MSTVFLQGDARVDRARVAAEGGARVVAWTAAAEAALVAAGVAHLTVRDLLGRGGRGAVEQAAADWTKELGRRPMLDVLRFRDLVGWDGLSLWWFAELYLHHSTRATARVRTVETLHRLLETLAPAEVDAHGLAPDDLLLLSRTCAALGVLFLPPGPRVPSFALAVLKISLASRWNTLKAVLAGLKSALGPEPAPAPGAALVLSHAAFWRERTVEGRREPYEHYFDRIIPALAEAGVTPPHVVVVGPRTPFRRRGALARLDDWRRLGGEPRTHMSRFTTWGVVRATWRATREVRAAWRRLRRLPALREAFAHRGVTFADLGEPDFASTLLLQLPWAVRSYEETREALATVQPAVLCLYAESSGWGRAALAAAARAGVPSVAIQHGIVYPGYYSYRHDADEGECPRPDRTAVFGEAARRLLVEMGHYDPQSLVVTGSPRFDALLEASRQWDRAALRRRFAVRDDESMVVVASRHQGIRETHESIGSAFPAFVRAVDAVGAVRCLVKPHPAEPDTAYRRDLEAAGAARTRVLPADTDLNELLFACDLLVTVESLSAVEALVLGRPVLVLNAPTNLSAMVEEGAALGVAAGEDPADALRAALFDAGTRDRLAAARARYVDDVASGVDGQATRRIVDLVHAAAAARAINARV